MIDHIHDTPMDISLRDWFAGLAMHAMIVSDTHSECTHATARDTGRTMQDVAAIVAYGHADAMLAKSAEHEKN